jgi:hypothetical protein
MASEVIITQSLPAPNNIYTSFAGNTGPAGPAGGVASVNGATGAVGLPQIGTNAATASTIPLRDASGRMKAAAPSASDDVTTKDYVDNTSGSVAVTNNSIPRRDGTGQLYVYTPSTAFAAATKQYVDDQAAAALISARPRILLAHTSSVTLTMSVWNRIGFSTTALENVGGTTYWDITAALSSRRVLVKLAGLYQIDYVFRGNAGALVGRVGTAPSATATAALGAAYVHGTSAPGLGQASASAVVRLAANTYVGCEIYNAFSADTTSGTNGTGSPTTEPHTLSITRISD